MNTSNRNKRKFQDTPECFVRSYNNNFIKYGLYLFIDIEKQNDFTSNVLNLYDVFFSNVHFAGKPIHPHENKFTIFKQILENQIIDKQTKNKLVEYYALNQRNYRNLCRAVYKYKYKRFKVYDIDMSLSGETLSDIPEYQKITIVENDVIYTFTVSDMLSIIKSALSFCSDMFVEAHDPYNPYTNISFSYHNLYNIFNHVKKMLHPKTSLLFDCFRKCDFDVQVYMRKYTPIILDEYLEEHINSISCPEKIDLVKDMIDHAISISPHIRKSQWIKDVYYPKFRISYNLNKIKDNSEQSKLIISIFEKYIKLYLIQTHSIVESNRYFSEKKLYKELYKLIESSPKIELDKFRKVPFAPQVVFTPIQQLNVERFQKETEIQGDFVKDYLINSLAETPDYEFGYPNIAPIPSSSRFVLKYNNIHAKAVEKKRKILNYIKRNDYYSTRMFNHMKVYLTERWIEELDDNHTEEEFQEFITIFMEFIEKVIRIEYDQSGNQISFSNNERTFNYVRTTRGNYSTVESYTPSVMIDPSYIALPNYTDMSMNEEPIDLEDEQDTSPAYVTSNETNHDNIVSNEDDVINDGFGQPYLSERGFLVYPNFVNRRRRQLHRRNAISSDNSDSSSNQGQATSQEQEQQEQETLFYDRIVENITNSYINTYIDISNTVNINYNNDVFINPATRTSNYVNIYNSNLQNEPNVDDILDVHSSSHENLLDDDDLSDGEVSRSSSPAERQFGRILHDSMVEQENNDLYNQYDSDNDSYSGTDVD